MIEKTIRINEEELTSIIFMDNGVMHLTKKDGAITTGYSKESMFMLIELARRNSDIKFIQEGADEKENNT